MIITRNIFLGGITMSNKEMKNPIRFGELPEEEKVNNGQLTKDGKFIPQEKRTEMVRAIECKETPEEKEYLLCYIATEDGEEYQPWIKITGRLEVVKFIIGMIEMLDIHESFLLSGNANIKNAISVYEFMKYVEENNFYPDIVFDIEDYNVE